jgi:diguanylate cyclase (GGDEF)-like protein/PAS domain S-box-containing protein
VSPAGVDNTTLRDLLTQPPRAYDSQRAELFSEKALARVILTSIGDGVLATDGEGRVQYLNPTAEKLTGWRSAEALGRRLSEICRLIDEEQGRDVTALVGGCLEKGQNVRMPERVTLQGRDGKRFTVESTCASIRDAEGRILGTVLILQDVSDRRLMALQLAHQATHDELTGLFNRQAFEGHLQKALEESRELGHTHALGYMDLDQFKVVNDTCGHLAGDELLCQVAGLLLETLRGGDLVARLGGDEFGILLPRCSLEEAERVIAAFYEALQRFRFTWRDKSFPVGASTGLVPIGRELHTVSSLLSAADHACYVAKEKGRNRVQVYQEDDATFVRRHDEMSWVVRIQETLEQNRFVLFSQMFQPLSPAVAPGLSFEVLLRMVEGDGMVHLPSDFIQAAERYGLMRRIDRWVIQSCLRILADQPPVVLKDLNLCSINLSGESLGDEGFLDFLEGELAAAQVSPGKLCFEITETAAIGNLSQARKLFARLSGRGVRFALDDFGTGLSSFSYLKELPVSLLKIDGKFIKDIVTDPLDRAMVESINQVGHVMGLHTVAEAVTGGAVVEQLRVLGVDYAQGNWISPPRPLFDRGVSAHSR